MTDAERQVQLMSAAVVSGRQRLVAVKEDKQISVADKRLATSPARAHRTPRAPNATHA
jgi:hypothetical protein